MQFLKMHILKYIKQYKLGILPNYFFNRCFAYKLDEYSVVGTCLDL